MKPFDFEAAKRGAEVCLRSGLNATIICFDSKCTIYHKQQPIIALLEDEDDDISVSSFSTDGHYYYEGTSNCDLMMRDDDYLEKLERGEYGDHSDDATKIGGSVIKRNLITETPTCKDYLQVPKGIIGHFNELEEKLYNLQYLIWEAMDSSCNAIKKLNDITNIINEHEKKDK